MSILLFIYGTLHPDRAPRGIVRVVGRLKPAGPTTSGATIRGRLLDLGDYPGLILADPTAPNSDVAARTGDSAVEQVLGEVFEVPDLATLAALDRYEDFRPDDLEASLFLRVEADVTLSDGSPLRCWVYVYNQP